MTESPATHAQDTITARLYGAHYLIVVEPLTLAPDRDAALRALIEQREGRWDEYQRQWRIERTRAAAFLDALAAEGFTVPDADRHLAMFRHAERERAYLDARAAVATVEPIEDRLAKRGIKLRDFQRAGVAWLQKRDRALLADAPGVGKTHQVLVALPEENRARGEKLPPVLVVCPANAKHVWQKHVPELRPDLKAIVLEGQGSFRWPTPGEVLITNYERLPDPGDVHASPATGTCVVADESHALRNARSLRSQRFKALSERCRNDRGRVWLLTGTPLLSHPMDLWNLASAGGLAEEHFGRLKDFKALFGTTANKHPCRSCKHKEPAMDGTEACSRKGCKCNAHVTETEEWGLPGPEVRERFARFALRRLREDVLPELPAKQFEDIPVRLAAIEKAGIDEQLAPGWEAAIEEAIETQGGVGFKQMASARRALAEAKIPAMLDVVQDYEDQDEALLVFSAHTAPLEALADRERWGLITGETPSRERGELERAFQAGELRGLGLNIKAGGTALTLTRASHVLFVDEEWNPGDNLQAQDRVCRQGQKAAGIMILRLVADHRLDQRLAEILDAKTKLVAASLG